MAPAGRSVYSIRRVEQLVAIRSPLAQEMIAAMERLGPCCVNELAAEVGRAAESLYYHIHKLLGAGLVVEGEMRRVGKRMERVYGLVADRIRVDPQVRSGPFLDALGTVFSAALRSSERDLSQALEWEKQQKGGFRDDSGLRKWIVHLRQDSLEELRAKLDDLDTFLKASNDSENGEAFSVLTAFSRVLRPADGESLPARRTGQR